MKENKKEIVVTFKVSPAFLEDIDRLVKEYSFKNRSAFIRSCICDYMKEDATNE